MNTIAKERWLLTLAAAALCAAPLGCNRPSDLGPVATPTSVDAIRTALTGEGAAVAGPAAATGTGWATLRGTFTYEADPPTMPPYDANKDPSTCAPGGKPPLQEYLVVDNATHGIANVAIYARSVSRVHDDAGPSTDELVFDQKVCRFLTHVACMTVNQPVSIKNSDDVGHNTKIEGQANFNQMIPASGTVPWKPQREEASPVSVHCSVHPWMIAYMLPRKNRYFAVTAKDGTFEIPNLPAGEDVEIQVWHESAAGSQGSLVVETAAAKELKWSKKGRIKVKLEENEVREIKIAVPASAFRAG
jgi:hypothetical protein